MCLRIHLLAIFVNRDSHPLGGGIRLRVLGKQRLRIQIYGRQSRQPRLQWAFVDLFRVKLLLDPILEPHALDAFQIFGMGAITKPIEGVQDGLIFRQFGNGQFALEGRIERQARPFLRITLRIASRSSRTGIGSQQWLARQACRQQEYRRENDARSVEKGIAMLSHACSRAATDTLNIAPLLFSRNRLCVESCEEARALRPRATQCGQRNQAYDC